MTLSNLWRGEYINVHLRCAFVMMANSTFMFFSWIACLSPVLAQQSTHDWGDLLTKDLPNTEAEYTEELWQDLFFTTNDYFDDLCMLDDFEQQVASLINEYGRHGPLVDLRLSFIDPVTFVTDCRQAVGYSRVDWGSLTSHPDHLDFLKEHEVRRLVSRRQVERFINDHNSLSRYHHFLMWIGLLYPQSNSEHVRHFEISLSRLEGFHEDSPEYWLYARDFVLMVYATGEIDRLVMADPEDLASYYPAWRDYVTERFGYFELNESRTGWVLPEEIPTYPRSECTLDRPEYPFEDWDPEITPPGMWTTNYLLYFDDLSHEYPAPSTNECETEESDD